MQTFIDEIKEFKHAEQQTIAGLIRTLEPSISATQKKGFSLSTILKEIQKIKPNITLKTLNGTLYKIRKNNTPISKKIDIEISPEKPSIYETDKIKVSTTKTKENNIKPSEVKNSQSVISESQKRMQEIKNKFKNK